MNFILITMICLNTLCIGKMFYHAWQQSSTSLSFITTMKLACSGVLSFISDTLGIGSFAVNIALAKTLRTFNDEELPAMNNGAQVMPGMLESLFFMQVFPVDFITLITLVTGTCLGGVLGAHVISHLNKQAIRLTMMICFIGMIGLLLVDILHLMPVNCTLVALSSWKLVIGFFAMLLCGALTTVGIGLFAMVQAVLFLLGVSPAVAFPIMTTAGAMQQPLSTLVFLQQNKIPLKKTLIVSVFGCLGVFLALPIVSHLNTDKLHALLLVIILFNLSMVSRTYWRSTQRYHRRQQTQTMASSLPAAT